MSGGPPHTHGPPNTAWNHLQVPNFYPRQPQNAHMSNEHHPLMHQPTWHTPTADPIKAAPHSQFYNLEQAIPERPYARHSPGVDLTLQRNGNQNGEVTAPISLSVRDTNKINSLPPEVLELTKSTKLVVKPVTALCKPTSNLPVEIPKNPKRYPKSMDSIIERLNPVESKTVDNTQVANLAKDKGVIVQPASNLHDESSNSTPTVDEDVVSPFSNNEDSTDSNKSRRKRKPFKTMRLSKDNETAPPERVEIETEQRRSESAPPGNLSLAPVRSRRKTSSESETIANIAAMVEKISPVKSEEIARVPTPAQKKLTETKTFVEVENQLEEMFAGIPDDTVKLSVSKTLESDENKSDDNLLKSEEDGTSARLQESVTSTSSDAKGLQKRTRKKNCKTRYSTESMSEESSPKRVKGTKKPKSNDDTSEKSKKTKTKPLVLPKNDKEASAYDSGSNTSSTKSKGPFVHIRGPRESPLSIHVVNSSISEEDIEKKSSKSKKYHDDGEYRHKVRSRGLHSSTLSNKYDAQTRDATWICVFCKLGPHSASASGDFAPGDLFGPYVITCNSPEYGRHLDDSYDKHFKSKKVARAVDSNSNKPAVKKSKRKHSESFEGEKNESDPYLGMSETGESTYEVWAHEDCLVWSPGVYLVGPKIVGLEEAVWSTCNVACHKCHFKGANLCCTKRGCVNVAHYGCAIASRWSLSGESYSVLCVAHRAAS